MKHCEEYSELISAFIDNEISEAEAETLKAHLATCRDCRAYLIFLEKIHTESAALAAEVPDGFSARVMNSIAVSKRAEKKFFLARFKFTAIAAAIILLVFVAGRLESFLPSVADNALNESSSETADSDSSAKDKELVPATLTPLYTETDAESAPLKEEKVRSVPQPAKGSSPEDKKEVKNQAVADSVREPKRESMVSDAPAVEKDTTPAPPISTDDKNETSTDTSVPDEILPPEQDIVTDNNAVASGGGSATSGTETFENALTPDAGAVPENATDAESTQDTSAESSETPSDADNSGSAVPPMPSIPQSEAYSCYISVKGEAALSLFSEYSSNIFDGNYLISIDKSNLSSTLSLLGSAGFTYHRYDGDNISSNFLLIIIP